MSGASSLAGQRILVTGAAGMTGAAIVAELLETDPTLRVRATWSSTPPWLDHPRLEWVRADLTVRPACRSVSEGIDSAVIAAAVTGGARALTDSPESQVTDNLLVDTLLLDSLARAGVRRCVFFSTGSLYQPIEGIIREEQLDRNAHPHAAHRGIGFVKRAAEQLCQFWHERTGMRFAIVRAANIYGPRASFEPARSNFIPALIRKAVEGLDPFEVWGRPDVVRDVIYVADAAEAAVRLLGVPDLGCETFNLGTGVPCTVGEVAGLALGAACHIPSSVVYSDSKPVTVASRVLDITALSHRLGWSPATPIEAGIRETVSWWQANKHSWKK